MSIIFIIYPGFKFMAFETAIRELSTRHLRRKVFPLNTVFTLRLRNADRLIQFEHKVFLPISSKTAEMFS